MRRRFPVRGTTLDIEREELLGLLGPKGAVAEGQSRSYFLPGSRRKSSVSWDATGLRAEVVVEVDGDGSERVVYLEGEYDPESDSFFTLGRDSSGESGDDGDPRAAAVAWRRMTAPMMTEGD